jgi:Uma2 family endonuclease
MTMLIDQMFTREEYLAIERAADHRSEFVNGRIYAMAGASLRHTHIVRNLIVAISNRLVGRPCEAYSNDLRVKVSETGMYTYPDVVGLCEEPRLEDDYGDTLLNPAVIIEVLSESTERYDRGDKFAHYRRIDTLREYILVAQDKVSVEQYVRHGDHWMLSEISDLDAVLRIEALGCEVALRDVYDRVHLAASQP